MSTHRLVLPRWDVGPRVSYADGRGRRRTRQHRPVWAALSANARPHWGARKRATTTVVDTVAALARADRVPAGHTLTVWLVWAPGDRRRADPPNLCPLQKACVDGLARTLGLPDDRPPYVHEHMPEIHPPPTKPGLWLMVQIGDPIA